MDSIALFKCLGDKSRLKIINALKAGPKYVEILSEALELSPSTVSFHLKKMEDVGLVSSVKEQYYVIYSLNTEIFNLTLSDLTTEEKSEQDKLKEKELEYREGVIKNFLKYGKLNSIPVQRKKKLIILEEIAKSFEMDKTYMERDVNINIADFHDDFCTIRRDLINEGFMERESGIYKRIK